MDDLRERIEVNSRYNAFLNELGLWEMRTPALPYLFQMAKLGLVTAIQMALDLQRTGQPLFWSPGSAQQVRDRVAGRGRNR